MKIDDRVYGTIQIKEPVLIELIKSPSIQRLKGISQYGVPDKYYSISGYSRYEHSVGVMILMKILNAPIEEQISGLLHDVSVTAFSHISDFLFGDGIEGDEGYHDSIHEEVVMNSEIPEILSGFGHEIKYILDERNFPLLENNIPDICGDRIDYSLRDLVHQGDEKIVKAILSDMTTNENIIFFNTTGTAIEFSYSFLGLNNNNWASPDSVHRYLLFSKMMRRAIDIGILDENDFLGEEDPIIEKVESSNDTEINNLLELLKLDKEKLSNKADKKNGKIVKKKFRYIDPYILVDDRLKRTTQIDSRYSDTIRTNKKSFESGYRF